MLLVSCEGGNEKNNGNRFSDMAFSLDTVIIDPGDEIIFLKYQLSNVDISKDGKYLFNFNEHDHTVEKINLDELRLEEKIPFEKEGPNGTGPSGGSIRVHNENQITITGVAHTSLFSLDGKKLATIFYENFSFGEPGTKGGELLKAHPELDTDANRLYVLIYSYDDGSYALGILNLEEFEVAKLKLKSFEEVSNFEINYISGGIEIIEPPQVNLEMFGTKVILSTSITNTLAWYDTEVDSLLIRSYNSQLTANKKEKEYKKEHETFEELEAEKRRFRQEINFLRPFWDDKSQHFHRFSYQELPTSLAGVEIKANVYLTVLDADLNQIGETLVPQLTKRPAKHFAKDGKIWIYENMDDEMGFVRLSISE